MDNEFNNWTKYHFLSFLFLFAAQSDSSVDKEELGVIREELDRFVERDHANANSRDILKSVIPVYRGKKPTEVINFINEHKREYLNETDREQALDSVENIFAADLEIANSELNSYRFIKSLLS